MLGSHRSKSIRTLSFAVALVGGLAASPAAAQCPYAGKGVPTPGSPGPFALTPAPQPQPPAWQDADPVYFHVVYWHQPAGGKADWCVLRNGNNEPVCFTNKAQADAAAAQLQARGMRAEVRQTYYHLHYWHSVNGTTVECLLRDRAGEVVCFPTRGRAEEAARQLQARYGYRTEVRPSESTAAYRPH